MAQIIRVRGEDGWRNITAAEARAEQDTLMADGWTVRELPPVDEPMTAGRTFVLATKPHADGSPGFESRLYRTVQP